MWYFFPTFSFPFSLVSFDEITLFSAFDLSLVLHKHTLYLDHTLHLIGTARSSQSFNMKVVASSDNKRDSEIKQTNKHKKNIYLYFIVSSVFAQNPTDFGRQTDTDVHTQNHAPSEKRYFAERQNLNFQMDMDMFKCRTHWFHVRNKRRL